MTELHIFLGVENISFVAPYLFQIVVFKSSVIQLGDGSVQGTRGALKGNRGADLRTCFIVKGMNPIV